MAECPVPLPQAYETKAELVSGGHTVEFYGTIVTGAFTLPATILSLGLAFTHMAYYSKPNEQKHIIRILFMVPVYTLFSSICTLSYPSSLYAGPLQESYEAIALASVFNLYCNYVEPSFDAQFGSLNGSCRAVLRQDKSGEFYPGQSQKSLRWFKTITFLVYQYVPIKILTTVLIWITQAAGVYCEDSMDAGFAHVWLLVIADLSLVVCVLAILRFYKPLKPSFVGHKAMLQLLCIKILVILDTLQAEVIKILLAKQAIKITPTWTYGDISVMIPALLVAVESFIVAIMFFFAFSPKEYHSASKYQHHEAAISDPHTSSRIKAPNSRLPLFLKALFEAVFMWDLLINTAQALRFLPSLFRKGGGAGQSRAEQDRRGIMAPSNKSSRSDFVKVHSDPSGDVGPPGTEYSVPYGAASFVRGQEGDLRLEDLA